MFALKIFVWIFRDGCCSIINVPFCLSLSRQPYYYIIVIWLCQQLFSFIFKSFFVDRCRFLATACISYHTFWCLSTTFLNFFKKAFLRSFSNGEGGIWTLAPLLTTYSLSRGAPSATWVLLQAVDFYLTCCYRFLCSGEGGIRTHGGTTHTGFQDRHHKPLGHLSVLHALVTCLIILTLFSQSVNTNFKLFSIFFCLFFAP